MNTTTPFSVPVPKPIAVGLCLALLAIFLGFGLGAAFGAKESAIKGHLDQSGVAVLDSVYHGDVAAKNAVVKKSWSYLKRSHMHGGAIGTSALAAIVLLLLIGGQSRLAKLSAVAFGAGAVLYSSFWLLAGLAAPGLGGTGLAKESLSFVALSGAGLCIAGLLGTICCVGKASFFANTKP
jgi:hypothetical protein